MLMPLVGMRLAQQAGNVPAAIQAARKALARARAGVCACARTG